MWSLCSDEKVCKIVRLQTLKPVIDTSDIVKSSSTSAGATKAATSSSTGTVNFCSAVMSNGFFFNSRESRDAFDVGLKVS